MSEIPTYQKVRNTTMKFTEAKLEHSITQLLEAQGYPHIKGEVLNRTPQDVLIKDDLRQFLSRLQT